MARHVRSPVLHPPRTRPMRSRMRQGQGRTTEAGDSCSRGYDCVRPKYNPTRSAKFYHFVGFAIRIVRRRSEQPVLFKKQIYIRQRRWLWRLFRKHYPMNTELGIPRSSVTSRRECFLANSDRCPSVTACGFFTKPGSWATPMSSAISSNRTLDEDFNASNASFAESMSGWRAVITDILTNPSSVIEHV